MISGNKGEWSEVYALLKVIADKSLYRGDGDLRKLEGAVLPIIRVLREESDGTYQYAIDDEIVIISGPSKEFRISVNKFQLHAKALLKAIKSASTPSFQINEIEQFITSFNCNSLKANSKVKSDIRIVLHDAATGTTPELGFSIKSQLGSASTLLNAGQTTNFVFKLNGTHLTKSLVDEVNSIVGSSKVKDRLAKLRSLSKSLEFTKTYNSIFANNLTLIDSYLPKILAEITYLFYTSPTSKLLDLTNEVARNNPLNYDLTSSHPFYLYKIKRFLTDIALGMMPSKVWTGMLEATGGYLIVKDDGEILAYHIYNRNDFEDYLLNNTKLETASTRKHNFGLVYEENGEQFFNLNLQIRFIK